MVVDTAKIQGCQAISKEPSTWKSIIHSVYLEATQHGRNQQDQPQPEEMHWAISYLREDLHDFRNETRTKIHGLHTRLDSQFRWMMTAMIGMTGLLAALIKL